MTTKLKIVFFGTPYYVLPILDSLNKAFGVYSHTSPIAAVVTQPPKPVGRKQIIEYSPVDTWAHKRNLPKFFRPEDIIANKIEADIGILASYGARISKEVIDYFPYGIVVVHPSILPQFRGASPVPAAIITNTNPTGVTIIKMDEMLDHGPILTSFKEDVLPTDTCETLRDRLFAKSAEILTQMIPAYLKGKISPKAQEESKASVARLVTKEDGFIPPKYIHLAMRGETPENKAWDINFIKIQDKPYSLNPTPQNLHNFIRAMYPWPQAWSTIGGQWPTRKRIKIIETHLESSQTITSNHQKTILVIDKVQLEGKKIISWKEFKNGYPKASFD
jgi:methionyl-tRNA formyltransferase